MSERGASEKVMEVYGPLGDGDWTVVLDDGFVDIGAADGNDNVCRVRRDGAQHLRDFARNLERAAEHLERADADR